MTRTVLNGIFGAIALGTVTIGGAGVWRMFNPVSVGATLLKEGHEIIRTHENDLWDRLVVEYEKQPNTQTQRISGFSFKAQEGTTDEQKKKEQKREELKTQCWSLLIKDHSKEGQDQNKENAKEWCTKSSSALKGQQAK